MDCKAEPVIPVTWSFSFCGPVTRWTCHYSWLVTHGTCQSSRLVIRTSFYRSSNLCFSLSHRCSLTIFTSNSTSSKTSISYGIGTCRVIPPGVIVPVNLGSLIRAKDPISHMSLQDTGPHWFQVPTNHRSSQSIGLPVSQVPKSHRSSQNTSSHKHKTPWITDPHKSQAPTGHKPL